MLNATFWAIFKHCVHIDLPTPIGCGRLLIFDFLVDEDVEELEAKILAVVDVLLKCER